MTDIFKEPIKSKRKNNLFQVGIDALQAKGWTVERVPRIGKSSVRKITKGSESKLVSIRTSQDTWIAFPRNAEDTGWATLEDVDMVLAVSVDDKENPRYAKAHLIDGQEVRERFNRAYEARKKAGHSLPSGQGIWVSLYEKDADFPVNRVGAGAGLSNEEIACVALTKEGSGIAASQPSVSSADGSAVSKPAVERTHITISEAKQLLASSLGIAATDITITINS